MHRIIVACTLFALLTLGCKTQQVQQPVRTKPQWVSSRPIDPQYYIGIGVVAKNAGPDFQTIAKKNALNDLASEIKITISTQSVLGQYQNNTEFRQTFESETRIAALNTIENFEVVDNWEDATHYYVYYRLSKESYHAAKRRKMMIAVERSENLFNQALQLHPVQGFTQSMRLKIKALAAVQDYLNEPIQSTIQGNEVMLVNELLSSIQNQLLAIRIESPVKELSGKVGKPIRQPIDVTVTYAGQRAPLDQVPLSLESETGRVRGGGTVFSNIKGEAQLQVISIMSRDPMQAIKVSVDMRSLIQSDSLNETLKSILTRSHSNSHLIKVQVAPLLVVLKSTEQNYGRPMNNTPLETLLRRTLNDNGVQFVQSELQADYVISLQANTNSAPPIWGNMQTATLSVSINLFDCATQSDIHKDGFSDIKGYHATADQAGAEAYKQALDKFNKQVLPKLMAEMYRLN